MGLSPIHCLIVSGTKYENIVSLRLDSRLTIDTIRVCKTKDNKITSTHYIKPSGTHVIDFCLIMIIRKGYDNIVSYATTCDSQCTITRRYHVVGRRGRDRMAVGFTTSYAISAYHHWCCEFKSRPGRGGQHYVIKFVSDLRQVGCFLRVLRFPPPIKLTTKI